MALLPLAEQNKWKEEEEARRRLLESQNAARERRIEEQFAKAAQYKARKKADAMTYGEAAAQIYTTPTYDDNTRVELFGILGRERSRQQSSFYDPYAQPTNNTVFVELNKLGIDTSRIDDNFFKAAEPLKQHLQYGVDMTPIKGKTKESKAAYYIWGKLAKDEENTKLVEQQWAALKKDIDYWANTRKDLNLSDEEVLAKIDWDKYKALQEIDESRKGGTSLYELNRPVDYSADGLRGAIWAARNGQSTGNSTADAVNYYMGRGNKYQLNPDTRKYTDINSGTYNPHMVAATANALEYFGLASVDQAWLDENMPIVMGGTDEVAKSAFQSLYNAEERTKKLETEIAEYNQYAKPQINGAIRFAKTFGIDAAMANMFGSGLQNYIDGIKRGDPIGLTRPVPFDYYSIVEQIKKGVEEQKLLDSNLAAAADIEEAAVIAQDGTKDQTTTVPEMHVDTGETFEGRIFEGAVNWTLNLFGWGPLPETPTEAPEAPVAVPTPEIGLWRQKAIYLNEKNLDFKNRPVVVVTKDNKSIIATWNMDANVGDKMTLASQSFDDGNGKYIVVTPILPDGTLLPQNILEQYVTEFFDGAGNHDDIVLAAFSGDNAKELSDQFAESLHESHKEQLTPEAPSGARSMGHMASAGSTDFPLQGSKEDINTLRARLDELKKQQGKISRNDIEGQRANAQTISELEAKIAELEKEPVAEKGPTTETEFDQAAYDELTGRRMELDQLFANTGGYVPEGDTHMAEMAEELLALNAQITQMEEARQSKRVEETEQATADTLAKYAGVEAEKGYTSDNGSMVAEYYTILEKNGGDETKALYDIQDNYMLPRLERAAFMTPEERSKYQWIYDKQGEKAANEWFDAFKVTELNKRIGEARVANARLLGEKLPILGGVATSVAGGLAQAGVGLTVIWNRLKDTPMRADDPAFYSSRSVNAVIEEVTKDMNPTAKLITNSVISGAQSLAAYFITGPLASLTMGLSVTGGTTTNLIDQGEDFYTASKLGLIEGAVATVVEKLGFDRITRFIKAAGGKGVGGLLKNFGKFYVKSVAPEIGEEVLEQVVGIFSDIAVRGPKSDYYKLYMENLNKYGNMNQALNATAQMVGQEFGDVIKGTAISTVLFALVGGAGNVIHTTARYHSAQENSKALAAIGDKQNSYAGAAAVSLTADVIASHTPGQLQNTKAIGQFQGQVIETFRIDPALAKSVGRAIMGKASKKKTGNPSLFTSVSALMNLKPKDYDKAVKGIISTLQTTQEKATFAKFVSLAKAGNPDNAGKSNAVTLSLEESLSNDMKVFKPRNPNKEYAVRLGALISTGNGANFITKRFGLAGLIRASEMMSDNAGLAEIAVAVPTLPTWSKTALAFAHSLQTPSLSKPDAARLVDAYVQDIANPEIMPNAAKRAEQQAVEIKTEQKVAAGAVDTTAEQTRRRRAERHQVEADKKAGEASQKTAVAQQAVVGAVKALGQNPVDEVAKKTADDAIKNANAAKEAERVAQEEVNKAKQDAEEAKQAEEQKAAEQLKAVEEQANAEVQKEIADAKQKEADEAAQAEQNLADAQDKKDKALQRYQELAAAHTEAMREHARLQGEMEQLPPEEQGKQRGAVYDAKVRLDKAAGEMGQAFRELGEARTLYNEAEKERLNKGRRQPMPEQAEGQAAPTQEAQGRPAIEQTEAAPEQVEAQPAPVQPEAQTAVAEPETQPEAQPAPAPEPARGISLPPMRPGVIAMSFGKNGDSMYMVASGRDTVIDVLDEMGIYVGGIGQNMDRAADTETSFDYDKPKSPVGYSVTPDSYEFRYTDEIGAGGYSYTIKHRPNGDYSLTLKTLGDYKDAISGWAEDEAVNQAPPAAQEPAGEPAVQKPAPQKPVAPVIEQAEALIDEAWRTGVEKKHGVKIEYDPNMKAKEEARIEGNVIYVNPNAGRGTILKGIVAHELTHKAERGGKKYQAYAVGVIHHLYGDDRQKVYEAVVKKMEQYKKGKHPIDEKHALAEIVAEFTRKQLYATEAELASLAKTNRSLVESILDWLNSIGDKIKETFGKDADIDGLRRKFEKALEAATSTAPGAQYSISDADYLSAVETGDTETQQRMVDEAAKQAGYVVKAYRGGTRNVYDRPNGVFLTSNEEIAKAFGTQISTKLLPSDYKEYNVKLGKSLHLDANGRNYTDIPVPKTHPDKAFVKWTQGFYEPGVVSADDLGEWAKAHGYDSVVIDNVKEGIGGAPATDYIILNPESLKSADPITYDDAGRVIPLSERFNEEAPDIRYSLVEDEETLSFLNNQESVTVYRAMQEIDGKLYPPMAAKVKPEGGGKKELQAPSQLGAWEQANERPDLIKDGKFTLDKANQSSIQAAYNPYFHTSLSPLNDQFSSAYNRPNLVVVEGVIPKSELTSGYRAPYAKDSVGETTWHSGPVASKLKGDKARRVYLSRWFKPVRIVPDAEVASKVAATLEGENIEIPYEVVTPTLAEELKKQGVRVTEAMQKDALYKGQPMFSLQEDSEGNRLSEGQREFFKDSKVRDEQGQLIPVYHGTGKEFTVFQARSGKTVKDAIGSHFGTLQAANDRNKVTGGDKVISAYLDIKNPLVKKDGSPMTESELNAYLKRVGKRLGIPDKYLGGNSVYDFVGADIGKQIQDELVKNGYDGIPYVNSWEDRGNVSWIVFNPNQVKQVNNLTPTASPDIRYSIGENEGNSELSPEEISRLIKEYGEAYGWIDAGETPINPEPLPQRTTRRTRVGRYARTIGESAILNPEQALEFKRRLLNGDFNHQPISDSAALNNVERIMERDGMDAAEQRWQKAVAGKRTPGKKDVAIGETLLKYHADNGDIDSTMKLAADLVQVFTRAGQTLQAARLLKQMTPVGQLYAIQRAVNQLNEKYEDNPIVLNEGLMNDLLQAKTEEEIEAAKQALQEDAGKQIPPDWKHALMQWRYFAMLANPKTHIRNIIGNAMFIPAVRIKDMIGAGIEAMTGQEERSKTLWAARYLRQYAQEDVQTTAVQQALRGGGKYNPTNAIEQYRLAFKDRGLGKAMNWLMEKNFAALEKEDEKFLNSHYVHALSSYLTANDIDTETADKATMDKARTYAIEEAKRATYRDASEVANRLNDLSKTKLGWIVESIVPFKKTPINILKRGLEYSPLGLINGIGQVIKAAGDVKSGKVEGNTEILRAIDRISAGMTGTGIVALGYLAGALGYLSVGFEKKDKEDEFGKLTGQQEYSLIIKIGEHEFNATIDWMVPISMPLLVGAAVNDVIKNGTEGLTFTDGLNALFSISEPIWNLTMLSGVNQAVESAGYGGGQPIVNIAMSSAFNLAGQFIPTLSGQLSRTLDPMRRQIYVTGNNELERNWSYFLGSARNKLSWAEDAANFVTGLVGAEPLKWMAWKNEPYINAWGEAEVENRGWFRALENFISPSYINQVDIDAVEKMMLEVSKETGDPNLLIAMPPKGFTVDGKDINMTHDQYNEFTKVRGQAAHDIMSTFVADPEYDKLDARHKAYMISDALEYGTQLAKQHIEPSYKLSGWVRDAKRLKNPMPVLYKQLESQQTDEYRKGFRTELFSSIDQGNVDAAYTAIEALMMSGNTKGNIKTSLTSNYKPLYKDYLADGNETAADDLMGMLMSLGVGFKAADIYKWGFSDEELAFMP